MQTTRGPRSGFTLVELLVVITIIGILISLLLPAVQAAREAARRAQCQNNLKQLGLGLMNYESTFKAFPPASVWQNLSDMNTQNQGNLRQNWAIIILPFIEQQPLYDSFDLSLPISDAANRDERGVELSTMLCPSDAYNRRKFDGTKGSQTSNNGDNWARGNYGANGALEMQSASYKISSVDYAAGTAEGWADSRIRGVMGANQSVAISEIRDGTSNTVMLLELRAGLFEYDPRGTWAMSGGRPKQLLVPRLHRRRLRPELHPREVRRHGQLRRRADRPGRVRRGVRRSH